MSRQPTLTKTSVLTLTRDIRRESAKIDNIMSALSDIAKRREMPIEEVLLRSHSAEDALIEALDVIDGTSAVIRSLIDPQDG